MSKKKILYIITQSEFGGAQRYLLELITHLDPEKYDITVAAGPGGDFLDRVKSQKHQIWRLKHLSRPINPIKDLKAYFELKTLINTIKPNILQLCSTKAGILGSLAAKKYNSHIRKFASHSRNLHVIYRIGGWSFIEDIPNWRKQLYIWLEKYTAKYKDTIINNCEAQRQLAIKLGIAPPEKIITIYNGLDLSNLNFLSREQARQKLNVRCEMLDVRCQLVGCIANFYKNKGLEYLIKAMPSIQHPTSNIQLLIIGDGIERQNLENLIREHKLESHVILTGKLKNAHQYLRAFDIFVLPSIKEGQPWTILEAMAAEVPIIAPNIAAIPEMLKNNESALLIKSKNPQAIREKIEYLIAHPDIAEKLTQNAKKTLEQKFTIQEMIQQTQKLYQ